MKKFEFGTPNNPAGMMNAYGRAPGTDCPFEGPNSKSRLSTLIFKSTHESIAKWLPEPLEPNYDADPIVSAFFLDMTYCTRFMDGYPHPYVEVGIWLPCKYKDKVGVTSGYMFLDGEGADIAISQGRERFGIPKQGAEISYSYQKDSLNVSVVKYGVPLVTMEFQWENEVDPQEAPDSGQGCSMWVKEFPSPSFRGYDFRQIVAQDWGHLSKPDKMRVGTGTIKYGHSDKSPCDLIEVVEIITASETEVYNESEGPDFQDGYVVDLLKT